MQKCLLNLWFYTKNVSFKWLISNKYSFHWKLICPFKWDISIKDTLSCITEICHNTYVAYFISHQMKTITVKIQTQWKAYRGVQVSLAVHCQIQLGLNSLNSHHSKSHRDEVKQSWNQKELENMLHSEFQSFQSF